MFKWTSNSIALSYILLRSLWFFIHFIDLNFLACWIVFFSPLLPFSSFTSHIAAGTGLAEKFIHVLMFNILSKPYPLTFYKAQYHLINPRSKDFPQKKSEVLASDGKSLSETLAWLHSVSSPITRKDQVLRILLKDVLSCTYYVFNKYLLNWTKASNGFSKSCSSLSLSKSGDSAYHQRILYCFWIVLPCLKIVGNAVLTIVITEVSGTGSEVWKGNQFVA